MGVAIVVFSVTWVFVAEDELTGTGRSAAFDVRVVIEMRGVVLGEVFWYNPLSPHPHHPLSPILITPFPPSSSPPFPPHPHHPLSPHILLTPFPPILITPFPPSSSPHFPPSSSPPSPHPHHPISPPHPHHPIHNLISSLNRVIGVPFSILRSVLFISILKLEGGLFVP